MAQLKKLEEVYDIEGFIEYGKSLDLAHHKFFLKEKISDNRDGNIIFNLESLIDKYFDVIQSQYVESYTLSDEDLIDYIYNPKRFCYEIYGTTELWSALLRINNMRTVMEFNQKNIKSFKLNILDGLTEILNLEKDIIQKNESEIES